MQKYRNFSNYYTKPLLKSYVIFPYHTVALQAAGETVLQRFIYYPVSGMLCALSPTD